jgi:hypothetical protein
MAKAKRGTVRKKKIKFPNGKELEIDAFDAEIVLGNGEEFQSAEELLEQAEIEESAQAALKEIDVIAQRRPDREKNIWYCYEVGKILQFVDEKGFTDRKGLIWRRMAYDLRPELFGRKRKNAEESKRYPETMYHLGKQLRKNVERANFDQWYEILKFKEIYRDKELLGQILAACEQGLSGIQLRQRIKDLRASKGKNK